MSNNQNNDNDILKLESDIINEKETMIEYLSNIVLKYNINMIQKK